MILTDRRQMMFAVRWYRVVCDGLKEVLYELKQIEDSKQVHDELFYNINPITNIVEMLYSTNAI